MASPISSLVSLASSIPVFCAKPPEYPVYLSLSFIAYNDEIRPSFGEKPMKNCLVVDDSRSFVKVASHPQIARHQRQRGVRWPYALNQCQSSDHDVVLLDWNMPVMSGMGSCSS